MEKTNYYAIVDSIVKGAFSEDYVITVGGDRREFNVHKSSLRRTRGGQPVAHIDITKRAKEMLDKEFKGMGIKKI